MIRKGDKFINIEYLNIDLIERINPFQGAYEILPKSETLSVLKAIQDTVIGFRVQMSEEEAVMICSNLGRESRKTLSDIFAEPDSLGLLKVKIRQSAHSGDQRLMACFQKIEQFITRTCPGCQRL